MSRGKALERLDKVFEKQQAAAIVDAIELMLEVSPRAEVMKAEREELLQCEADWKGTLEHFGIKRPVLPFEHMVISQLVRQHGVLATRYALAGMQYEKKTRDFDPKDYVGIRRALDPKLFERFVNLLSIAKSEENKKTKAPQSVRALLPGHMKEGKDA